ncbi:MAG: type II toxin-antitoxin system VapC family toxin [Candidatus Bathycorpusculaceae bacterium]
MRKGLLYIDSNIFLHAIIYDLQTIAEARNSKDLLLKIARGEVEAYTATITWDEIAWILRKIFDHEFSIEQSKKFLIFPNLRLLAVKKSTVLKAQELVEKHMVKPRDAIHAAAALENRIETFVSYDKDFDRISEVRRIEP